MGTRNEKQPDQKRIVATLASECRMPLDEMATLYEQERAQLALDAHVTKYLHIFATRNVLDLVRRRVLHGPLPAGGSSVRIAP